MAEDSPGKSSSSASRTPGVRNTPVLVPQGAMQGQPEIPLDRPVTTAGSGDRSRLHLVSRTVSKGHAIFVNSGRTTYVVDLSSRTGVLVNGKPVKDTELKTGDRVQIGKFIFRYRSPTNLKAAEIPIEAPAGAIIVVGSPAIPLARRAAVIGRRETSDVAITVDSGVSAAHAVVFQMDGRWFIRDLQSRTGTKINGKAIHQQELKFGDHVDIGSTAILFQPGAAAFGELAELEDQDVAAPTVPDISHGWEDDSPENATVDQPSPEAAEHAFPAEDAIPLEDEPRSSGTDWKSAFAVPESEIELPAVEPVSPVDAESNIVASEEVVAPFDEVPAHSTTDAAPTDSPLVEVEAAKPAAVDSDTIESALEATENLSLAIPVETDIVPLPDTVPLVGEPAPQAEIEPLPLDTSVKLDAPLQAGDEATTIENAPVEPVAVEPVLKAELPPTEVAPPVAAPSLAAHAAIGEIDDFVFVPDATPADAVPIPEVIFWGETELDGAAEDAVVHAAPPNIKLPATSEDLPVANDNVDAPPESESTEGAAELEPDQSTDESPSATAAPITNAPIEERAATDVIAHEPATIEASNPVTPENLSAVEQQGDVRIAAPVAAMIVETPKDEAHLTEEFDLADDMLPAALSAAQEPFEEPEAFDLFDDLHAEPSGEHISLEAEAKATPEIGATDLDAVPPAIEREEFEEPEEFDFFDDLHAEPLVSAVAELAAPVLVPAIEAADLESISPIIITPQQLALVDEPEVTDLDLLLPHTDVTESEVDLAGWSNVDEAPLDEQHITVTEPIVAEPSTDEPPTAEPAPFSASEVEHGKSDVPAEGGAVAGTPPAPQMPPPQILRGPSVFGFSFEGDSFLGGAPLPLHRSGTSPPPAKSFDLSVQSPAGLGGATAPPEMPKPAARPMTPPRPDLNRAANANTLTSLSGLVGQGGPSRPVPVIPPTVRESGQQGNQGGALNGDGTANRPLTTSFAAPGVTPRSVDVFSQMATPIGVEVFGKPSNGATLPAMTEVPVALADKNLARSDAELAAANTVKPRKARWFRIPLLLVLAALLPGLLWVLCQRLVPISAEVVGTLSYDMGSAQMVDDVHAFKRDQPIVAYSGDVRTAAQNILMQNHQDAGFTSKEDDYAEVVGSQTLQWVKDSHGRDALQFTLHGSGPDLVTAQVNAVLTALARKDRVLEDRKDAALQEAYAADKERTRLAGQVEELNRQRRALTNKAQDAPDISITSQAEQDANQYNQQYLHAKALRESSEAALADLRSQDPGKPIDVEADPQVVAIKKQLQPITDQMNRLKPAVSTDGATTQPASTDPLYPALLEQANALTAKLNQRRQELTALASLGPAQREVNLASAIENLSVKITELRKNEADAKTAADAARAQVDQYQARTAAAHVAGRKAEEIYLQQQQLNEDLAHAVETQTQKEQALARCITVAQESPLSISPGKVVDPRFAAFCVFTLLAWSALGLLVAAEMRRPKITTGVRPNAAPLVYPAAPSTAVPWPKPEQIQGLDQPSGRGLDQLAVAEAEQALGI